MHLGSNTSGTESDTAWPASKRGSGDAEKVRMEAQHVAMGTVYAIAAYASPAICLGEAIEEAFAEIDRLDALMSRYRPSSEICTINREAGSGPVPVSAELFALLEAAFRISEETGGTFDVTIGPLMKAWGFFRRNGRIPSELELAETRARVGYRKMRLDRGRRAIAFERPGMELDLGAIGKGYAVDRAVDVLRAHGVHDALISSGTSSIAALGAPPGQRGWRIELCHPLGQRRVLRGLRLRNLSLSVSGGSEQMFVMDGRTYTHLLNPRTGCPAEGCLMTAVVGIGNALTDAMSTALFVMGEDEARIAIKQHPGMAALLFKSGGRQQVQQAVLGAINAESCGDCLLELAESTGDGEAPARE